MTYKVQKYVVNVKKNCNALFFLRKKYPDTYMKVDTVYNGGRISNGCRIE